MIGIVRVRVVTIAIENATMSSFKSYCGTVHFRRITSIYQPTNAHIISHKTLLKHFKNTPTCFDLVRSSSGSFVPC